MEKSKVKLNICGTSYTITSDDTEEYMYSIGEKVDKKIKSILENNSKLSTLMAAELAALEYCDLLSKASISIENLKKQLKDLKENLDIKELELKDINIKTKYYENKLKKFEYKNENFQEMPNKEIITYSTSKDEVVGDDHEIFADFNH